MKAEKCPGISDISGFDSLTFPRGKGPPSIALPRCKKFFVIDIHKGEIQWAIEVLIAHLDSLAPSAAASAQRSCSNRAGN